MPKAKHRHKATSRPAADAASSSSTVGPSEGGGAVNRPVSPIGSPRVAARSSSAIIIDEAAELTPAVVRELAERVPPRIRIAVAPMPAVLLDHFRRQGPEEERRHISYSELKTRKRCGHLHRLRYREGMRLPMGVAGIRGTGLHDSAAHNYRQKVSSRRDVNVGEVENVAAESVWGSFAGEVHLTHEERSVGLKLLRGRIVDVAVGMARAYHHRVAPHVQPAYVEELIRLRPDPSKLDFDVVGKPDVATVDDQVRDIKSKEKPPDPGEEHKDEQLTIYHLLHKAKTGRYPREVGFDIVSAPKTGAARDTPTTSWRPSSRTREDMQALLLQLQEIGKSIKSGADPPTDPSNWWCSPKWCGAWDMCPYVAGRRARGER